jgi:nitrogen fixation protein NifU and related proteins
VLAGTFWNTTCQAAAQHSFNIDDEHRTSAENGVCRILSAMFNDTVLDHFRHPRNAGDLHGPAVVQVTNPVCGDVLRLSALVENGRISAARFKVQGCVAAIASGSVLTELLVGKSPTEARLITPQVISDALGVLPEATFHAAQLGADAVTALVGKLPRF